MEEISDISKTNKLIRDGLLENTAEWKQATLVDWTKGLVQDRYRSYNSQNIMIVLTTEMMFQVH